MDRRLQNTIDRLIDLSSALLETTLHLKDLVEPKPDYWCSFI